MKSPEPLLDLTCGFRPASPRPQAKGEGTGEGQEWRRHAAAADRVQSEAEPGRWSVNERTQPQELPKHYLPRKFDAR